LRSSNARRATVRARRCGASNCRRERPNFGRTFHDVAASDAEGADVLRLFFARENAELDAAA
jgi:hypothetical protein